MAGTWEFEGRKLDGRFIFTEYPLISCETRSWACMTRHACVHIYRCYLKRKHEKGKRDCHACLRVKEPTAVALLLDTQNNFTEKEFCVFIKYLVFGARPQVQILAITSWLCDLGQATLPLWGFNSLMGKMGTVTGLYCYFIELVEDLVK